LLGRAKIDKLAETAFEQMEAENSDVAVVGVCLLAVEVRTEDGETAFYTFATDRREWIQRALIHEAAQAIEFAEVELDGD